MESIFWQSHDTEEKMLCLAIAQFVLKPDLFRSICLSSDLRGWAGAISCSTLREIIPIKVTLSAVIRHMPLTAV